MEKGIRIKQEKFDSDGEEETCVHANPKVCSNEVRADRDAISWADSYVFGNGGSERDRSVGCNNNEITDTCMSTHVRIKQEVNYSNSDDDRLVIDEQQLNVENASEISEPMFTTPNCDGGSRTYGSDTSSTNSGSAITERTAHIRIKQEPIDQSYPWDSFVDKHHRECPTGRVTKSSSPPRIDQTRKGNETQTELNESNVVASLGNLSAVKAEPEIKTLADLLAIPDPELDESQTPDFIIDESFLWESQDFDFHLSDASLRSPSPVCGVQKGQETEWEKDDTDRCHLQTQSRSPVSLANCDDDTYSASDENDDTDDSHAQIHPFLPTFPSVVDHHDCHEDDEDMRENSNIDNSLPQTEPFSPISDDEDGNGEESAAQIVDTQNSLACTQPISNEKDLQESNDHHDRHDGDRNRRENSDIDNSLPLTQPFSPLSDVENNNEKESGAQIDDTQNSSACTQPFLPVTNKEESQESNDHHDRHDGDGNRRENSDVDNSLPQTQPFSPLSDVENNNEKELGAQIDDTHNSLACTQPFLPISNEDLQESNDHHDRHGDEERRENSDVDNFFPQTQPFSPLSDNENDNEAESGAQIDDTQNSVPCTQSFSPISNEEDFQKSNDHHDRHDGDEERRENSESDNSLPQTQPSSPLSDDENDNEEESGAQIDNTQNSLACTQPFSPISNEEDLQESNDHHDRHDSDEERRENSDVYTCNYLPQTQPFSPLSDDKNYNEEESGAHIDDTQNSLACTQPFSPISDKEDLQESNDLHDMRDGDEERRENSESDNSLPQTQPFSSLSDDENDNEEDSGAQIVDPQNSLACTQLFSPISNEEDLQESNDHHNMRDGDEERRENSESDNSLPQTRPSSPLSDDENDNEEESGAQIDNTQNSLACTQPFLPISNEEDLQESNQEEHISDADDSLPNIQPYSPISDDEPCREGNEGGQSGKNSDCLLYTQPFSPISDDDICYEDEVKMQIDADNIRKNAQDVSPALSSTDDSDGTKENLFNSDSTPQEKETTKLRAVEGTASRVQRTPKKRDFFANALGRRNSVADASPEVPVLGDVSERIEQNDQSDPDLQPMKDESSWLSNQEESSNVSHKSEAPRNLDKNSLELDEESSKKTDDRRSFEHQTDYIDNQVAVEVSLNRNNEDGENGGGLKDKRDNECDDNDKEDNGDDNDEVNIDFEDESCQDMFTESLQSCISEQDIFAPLTEEEEEGRGGEDKGDERVQDGEGKERTDGSGEIQENALNTLKLNSNANPEIVDVNFNKIQSSGFQDSPKKSPSCAQIVSNFTNKLGSDFPGIISESSESTKGVNSVQAEGLDQDKECVQPHEVVTASPNGEPFEGSNGKEKRKKKGHSKQGRDASTILVKAAKKAYVTKDEGKDIPTLITANGIKKKTKKRKKSHSVERERPTRDQLVTIIPQENQISENRNRERSATTEGKDIPTLITANGIKTKTKKRKKSHSVERERPTRDQLVTIIPQETQISENINHERSATTDIVISVSYRKVCNIRTEKRTVSDSKRDKKTASAEQYCQRAEVKKKLTAPVSKKLTSKPEERKVLNDMAKSNAHTLSVANTKSHQVCIKGLCKCSNNEENCAPKERKTGKHKALKSNGSPLRGHTKSRPSQSTTVKDDVSSASGTSRRAESSSMQSTSSTSINRRSESEISCESHDSGESVPQCRTDLQLDEANKKKDIGQDNYTVEDMDISYFDSSEDDTVATDRREESSSKLQCNSQEQSCSYPVQSTPSKDRAFLSSNKPAMNTPASVTNKTTHLRRSLSETTASKTADNRKEKEGGLSDRLRTGNVPKNPRDSCFQIAKPHDPEIMSKSTSSTMRDLLQPRLLKSSQSYPGGEPTTAARTNESNQMQHKWQNPVIDKLNPTHSKSVVRQHSTGNIPLIFPAITARREDSVTRLPSTGSTNASDSNTVSISQIIMGLDQLTNVQLTYLGEVVERCTIAHFRTFITSNPCRIVECSSFLYFSVPMYRKQLGLSENIYLCSLSLDFLAVIAFQSSKNHENSDFSVKFTYISFSSFLKSHFTAHCEFCALPHTSQFKYQILLECLDAKSRAPGKAE